MNRNAFRAWLAAQPEELTCNWLIVAQWCRAEELEYIPSFVWAHFYEQFLRAAVGNRMRSVSKQVALDLLDVLLELMDNSNLYNEGDGHDHEEGE